MGKNDNPFPSYYEEFIHVSRYARWKDEERRRETWGETVSRLVQYYRQQVDEGKARFVGDVWEEIYNAICSTYSCSSCG